MWLVRALVALASSCTGLRDARHDRSHRHRIEQCELELIRRGPVRKHKPSSVPRRRVERPVEGADAFLGEVGPKGLLPGGVAAGEPTPPLADNDAEVC